MPNTPTLGLPYPTPGDTADVPRDMQALAVALDGGAFMAPIGAIFLWPVANPPAKWLTCNGQAIPAEFDKLIALIGPNVPDLQDKVPVGASGTKAVRSTGGSAQITEAQLPAHGHNPGTLATVAGNSGQPTASLNHYHDSTGWRFVVTTGTPAPLVIQLGTMAGQPVRNLMTVQEGGAGVSYDVRTGGINISGDLPHVHTLPALNLNGKSADAGGGQAYWPPYLALNYIIRAG